jgi:hypothetical protein
MNHGEVSALSPRRIGRGARKLVLPIALMLPTSIQAIEFSKGDVFGSFDTTLSYGIGVRMSDRNPNTVGAANGGTGFSVNVDDGNLNYDSGDIFSNVIKFTSEFELNYKDVGAFVRGTGFYDFENKEGDRARTKLSDRARDLVGSRARFLDAYGWYRFDVGDSPGEVRIGEQVLSWGESTFIQNGINSINPVNVSALRVPGSEIKEALVPVPMVVLTMAPTDNTSFEFFYQLDWERTEIDPPGSYFSTNDFVGQGTINQGGDRVVLGRGTYPDGAIPGNGFRSVADTFQAVPRAGTREPSDSGQFGVAFRILAPALNDTEFGLFFIKNHNRLPLVSGITGTPQGALAARAIATSTGGQVAGTVLQALTQGATQAQATQQGIAVGQTLGQTSEQATVIAETTAEQGALDAVSLGAITDAATDAYARTAFYRTEYPEDIKLFGASFNTQLGTTGIALQGEMSYRWDVPVQINTIELIGAVLGAIEPTAANANQIGNFSGQFETDVPGFTELDILQFQTTATKVFGPIWRANSAVLVGEVGVTHILDYPSQSAGGPNDKGLRLNGPNTELGGNPALVPGANQAFAGQQLGPEHFVSETSWGYQLRGQLLYNNAIGPINLLPHIAWRHDVDGISPGPGENFLQGRKAILVGLGATYLASWRADLSYTEFFGAGDFNLLGDRDFVSASISYSF